jgi:hypothetical protein
LIEDHENLEKLKTRVIDDLIERAKIRDEQQEE